ncbi:MAG: NAD-dependent protein deacylase [Lachnospiraceae bacterium]|nr:NAD-dependent protein deacylase [Lachnospiraceae bacterium]
MTEKETLKKWLEESDNIVFFGGAGVSTESKIPDFRSTDGLYNQQYAYPPETILSHTFYLRKTEEFYRFYRNKMLFPDAQPNRAHLALARLERMGKLRAVITQNIDGLHQKAGSREVLELHGSVLRNFCTQCKKSYGLDAILGSEGVPGCDCGGVIKPDVVLYEEGLDQDILEKAVSYISQADVLIIGGTSLTVYPAAGLLNYYRGNRLVLINKSVTPMDSRADLVISGPIGEILGEAVEGIPNGL